MLSWNIFDQLIPEFQKITEEKYRSLFSYLRIWDDHLVDFGKDPTWFDWRNFRPLRLSREEDWCDWLGYLIASSTTGAFASLILNESMEGCEQYAKPQRMLREDSFKGYRADIIIEWRNQNYTHIEMKIGDPHLRKTLATGRMLQKKYRVTNERWRNHILLMSEQLTDWEIVVEKDEQSNSVSVITWGDVCVALRKSFFTNEKLNWKALAYNFLGAIEQHIIGFPGYRIQYKPASQLAPKLEILTKALNDEGRN